MLLGPITYFSSRVFKILASVLVASKSKCFDIPLTLAKKSCA